MTEIITKSGKKIGKISDSLTEDDILIIDGKEIKLSDIYSNNEIKKIFNTKVKELKDDTGSSNNT